MVSQAYAFVSEGTRPLSKNKVSGGGSATLLSHLLYFRCWNTLTTLLCGAAAFATVTQLSLVDDSTLWYLAKQNGLSPVWDQQLFWHLLHNSLVKDKNACKSFSSGLWRLVAYAEKGNFIPECIIILWKWGLNTFAKFNRSFLALFPPCLYSSVLLNIFSFFPCNLINLSAKGRSQPDWIICFWFNHIVYLVYAK